MQVDLFGGCFSVSGHGNLKENGQKRLLLSSGNIRKPIYTGHGCRRVKSVARGIRECLEDSLVWGLCKPPP